MVMGALTFFQYLADQTITGPDGGTIHFDIDPARKAALIDGLDDIAQTEKQVLRIEAFESEMGRTRPWV